MKTKRRPRQQIVVGIYSGFVSSGTLLGSFTIADPCTFLDDNGDSDEDDSDANSCASDETEKRPLGYTDLSKRFHTISVNVKPNQLLSYNARCAIEGTSGSNGYAGFADPIRTAALEQDAEAFAQIADVCLWVANRMICVLINRLQMMTNLAEPMSIPDHILLTIIQDDSPDLLDVSHHSLFSRIPPEPIYRPISVTRVVDCPYQNRKPRNPQTTRRNLDIIRTTMTKNTSFTLGSM